MSDFDEMNPLEKEMFLACAFGYTPERFMFNLRYLKKASKDLSKYYELKHMYDFGMTGDEISELMNLNKKVIYWRIGLIKMIENKKHLFKYVD